MAKSIRPWTPGSGARTGTRATCSKNASTSEDDDLAEGVLSEVSDIALPEGMGRGAKIDLEH
ncbi:hypothetical protein [Varunaivibrio sulfuroxidans]|uniref:hypothetical protein n=1 Tax=Varunaivibrio sulfuroxidans TaxID=1773489 RepID=UPI0023E30623|nr:hypothetical protein [Varunaivibrio sulfuroxidans]WES31112.1 hypothetical protein P3M64_01675 [Varunaivibrio sulfuroxidans]